MNRIPRTRFVTLMAAAAGVTAGFGSTMAAPGQALASTHASALVAADTVPNAKLTAAAKAAAPAKGTAAAKASAPAKASTAAKTAAAEKPAASAKKVVAAAASNEVPKNDVCGSEADCRNADGGGW